MWRSLENIFFFSESEGSMLGDDFSDSIAWRSVSDNFSGMYTMTLISSSPVPYPSVDGSPLPRRRNTLPGCVPAVILSLARPLIVGTSTEPPRMAVGMSSIRL